MNPEKRLLVISEDFSIKFLVLVVGAVLRGLGPERMNLIYRLRLLRLLLFCLSFFALRLYFVAIFVDNGVLSLLGRFLFSFFFLFLRFLSLGVEALIVYFYRHK